MWSVSYTHLGTMQHGGLLAAQGQARQAGSWSCQRAVGGRMPLRSQLQAIAAGQDIQLERRALALHDDDLAAQRLQTRQGSTIEAQDAVEARLDACQ